MSKGKKVLNYTAMGFAILAIVAFFMDENWNAVVWAFIALLWIVNTHLTEDLYYDCKENLKKLSDDYFDTLITHGNEVKELKGKIEKLEKENKS